ncbi:uncharacterized protein JN550_000579 [Neoarthrinium moseri]|uniref:uncharacterized protein n=1 Tax=Neoarthrinium moseri TaxID=1658444 RepID=UPI001FDCA53B|nr:uncharacterized protein JN550_000579 [Neoarthrinium moseri]KAI1878397.1 hypothetical protein JN550_000579 [Neoarthrinium moseri]
MYPSKIFVAITGFLGASQAVANQARALNDAQDAQPGLAARQQSACATAASSILSSVPTGNGGFASVVNSLLGTGGVISPTRVCQVISALPSSLESEFSSYDNAVATWFSSESSRIDSLVSSCSNDTGVQSLASMTSGLAAYASGCNATTTSGGSSTGASSSGSSGTGSATAGSSAGGAPRETGFVAGVVMAAGFLGAVAML